MQPNTHVYPHSIVIHNAHHTQYVTHTQSRNYQHALPPISVVVGYSTVSVTGTPSFTKQFLKTIVKNCKKFSNRNLTVAKLDIV